MTKKLKSLEQSGHSTAAFFSLSFVRDSLKYVYEYLEIQRKNTNNANCVIDVTSAFSFLKKKNKNKRQLP